MYETVGKREKRKKDIAGHHGTDRGEARDKGKETERKTQVKR